MGAGWSAYGESVRLRLLKVAIGGSVRRRRVIPKACNKTVGIGVAGFRRLASAVLRGAGLPDADRRHPETHRRSRPALADVTCVSSCGVLSGWRAESGLLATAEYLDDAHRAAAVRAWLSQRVSGVLSVFGASSWNGASTLSSVLIFATLALRPALASRP